MKLLTSNTDPPASRTSMSKCLSPLRKMRRPSELSSHPLNVGALVLHVNRDQRKQP